VTKEGLFKFIRAPFGYCNSPTVFVRYVTYISTAHKCRYYDVPKCMEKEIITSLHNFGHMGTLKTTNAIQQDFYISHLEKKVMQTIANCIECITHIQKLGRQDDFLHSINKGDTPLNASCGSSGLIKHDIKELPLHFCNYGWLFQIHCFPLSQRTQRNLLNTLHRTLSRNSALRKILITLRLQLVCQGATDKSNGSTE